MARPPGMTSKPVWKGLRCRRFCRYSGTRIIEPIIARNAIDISSRPLRVGAGAAARAGPAAARSVALQQQLTRRRTTTIRMSPAATISGGDAALPSPNRLQPEHQRRRSPGPRVTTLNQSIGALLRLPDVLELPQAQQGDHGGDGQHEHEQVAPRAELQHQARDRRAHGGRDRDGQADVAHDAAAVLLGDHRHQRGHQQRHHHRGTGRPGRRARPAAPRSRGPRPRTWCRSGRRPSRARRRGGW